MSKNNMQVSVIVPNYNGYALLEKNLPHIIRAKDNPQNSIKDIIVVDDGSSDNSVQLLKKDFSQVTLIRHKKNQGFSRAINTGIEFANTPLIALVNTDVIVSENFIAPALTHFNDNAVFAVSFSEQQYSWAKGYFKDGFVEHSPGSKTKKTHISFWANGGSGLFVKDTFIKLGKLDNELYAPFYWEDVDICYRAWKRGYKVLWEPRAKVVHKHAQTISKIKKTKRDRIMQRNQLLFVWKNITSKRLFKKHIICLVGKTIRHPKYTLILLTALIKLKEVRLKRKVELREGKISDEAIFQKFLT